MNFSHVIIGLSTLFFIAGCDAPPPAAQSESSVPDSALRFTGENVEIAVIGFSAKTQKTEVELRNGRSKPIREIKGYLSFIDSAGNELSFSNGAPKRSPFQRVENPHLVDAQSQKRFSLRNKIEKGAAEVIVVLTEASYSDGSSEAFE